MPLIETFGGDSVRGYGEFNAPGFSYSLGNNSASTLSQSNGYNTLTFGYNGGTTANFIINSGKRYFDILVVGGGGGGGAGRYWSGSNPTGLGWGVYAGAGGGAGGVYAASNVLLGPGTYPLIVGFGGSGGVWYYGGQTPSGNGQSSSFNGITVTGGNGGAAFSFSNTGGSSGINYPQGSSPYAGGSSTYSGGGGGSQGAGTAASSGGQYVGYSGGAGTYWSVNGLVYARGGGSPNASYSYNSGQPVPTETNSYPNGGNGGGGAWAMASDGFSQGGYGALGTVILRWKQ